MVGRARYGQECAYETASSSKRDGRLLETPSPQWDAYGQIPLGQAFENRRRGRTDDYDVMMVEFIIMICTEMYEKQKTQLVV